MPGRAPDHAVLEAARRVLSAAKTIVSLRELRAQVVRELRSDFPEAQVDPRRLRRLLVTQPFARLELRARKGSRDKVLSKCPVCMGRLERIRNQTLFGGEVTLTLRCPVCGYWTGREKRIPTLYVFHYEPPASSGGHASVLPQQPL